MDGLWMVVRGAESHHAEGSRRLGPGVRPGSARAMACTLSAAGKMSRYGRAAPTRRDGSHVVRQRTRCRYQQCLFSPAAGGRTGGVSPDGEFDQAGASEVTFSEVVADRQSGAPRASTLECIASGYFEPLLAARRRRAPVGQWS